MKLDKDKKVLVMGGLIVDKYIVTEQYPSRGEDVLITNSFNRVGGCTINVVSALNNLEIDAYPVSTVGGDENGNIIEKYLLEANIGKNCVMVEKDKNTGYCLVILDDTSERTFMTYKGCEEEFYYKLINCDLMKEIKFVYLTGYYLLGSFAAEILSFIKDIKELGASIMFDPGPLVDKIQLEILQLALDLCDIFIPNFNEIEKVKIKLNIVEGVSKWIEKNKIQYLIIKNGSKGVTAYKGNKKYEISAYNVKAIDTTGAGDSFAAGCIYGFLNDMEFEEILNIGSACGAMNTTFIGPNGKYGVKDIEKLIKEEIDNA
ncbi:carbohydrate kinase family protein [Clostridium drakei]|uniref:Carbohydrate kinase n=1 Tax=Clostridium drakei TaxID=332101 RepID=A0A2U8DPG1_9CLOT|nr:carbohydrate kinase family protein [Clostridium drakei]AWI04666.1 carbohydrate kinase [Clostridium drakei]